MLAIINAIQGKIPNVKVLLLGILPRVNINHHIHLTNDLLAKHNDNKTIFFLDMTSHFETSPGHQNTKLYIADKTHLTKEGYQIFYHAMEPLFSKLIA